MELSKDVQVAVETSTTLAIIVTDTASEIQAATNLRELQARKKLVEDWFKHIKQNAYQSWKAICNKETETLKPIEDIIGKIKSSLSEYNQIQLKKLEAEKAEQAKILEDAIESGNLAIVPEVQEVAKNVKLDNGMRTISYIDDVDVEVTDIVELAKLIVKGKLPAYFILPNHSEIKNHVKKSKLTELAGVKITKIRRVR